MSPGHWDPLATQIVARSCVKLPRVEVDGFKPYAYCCANHAGAEQHMDGDTWRGLLPEALQEEQQQGVQSPTQ